MILVDNSQAEFTASMKSLLLSLLETLTDSDNVCLLFFDSDLLTQAELNSITVSSSQRIEKLSQK